MTDPLADIDEIVRQGERSPGSDAERRAARHVERRLRELGREAEVESFDVRPRVHLTHALHVLIAVVGSVLSVSAPIVGGSLVLAALLLTFLDGTGLLLLTRRLTGRRVSQNVISREDTGKPGTLVLVAHCDAGRTGAAYGRFFQERRATLGRLLRRPIGPLQPVLWSMLVVLVCCVLRVLGFEATPLTVVQFVPTVVLILVLPMLVDVALSGASPGANDNASGVATVLRLLEGTGGLEHFDVWVLVTGGNEAGAIGARAFLKRHKKSLPKESTVFVNIDEVGAGTVRYTRREGLVYSVRSHVQLVEICDDIAEDDEGEDSAFGARPMASRTTSDGYAARLSGFPAITITCRNALDYVPHHHQPSDTARNLDPEALDRAHGFCAELIERLDAEIGPELPEPAAEDGVLSEAE